MFTVSNCENISSQGTSKPSFSIDGLILSVTSQCIFPPFWMKNQLIFEDVYEKPCVSAHPHQISNEWKTYTGKEGFASPLILIWGLLNVNSSTTQHQ